MSSEILSKYLDLTVVNSSAIAQKMSLQLEAATLEVKQSTYGGNPLVGWFYLGRSVDHPGMVFECTVTPQDSISSVYMEHPMFESRAELMRTREALMNAIAADLGLSVEGVGIDDHARGRTLGLSELATGQLVDMLAQRSIGKQIIVTNNHSAAGLVKADTSLNAAGGGFREPEKFQNQDMERLLRDADVAEGNITIAVTN